MGKSKETRIKTVITVRWSHFCKDAKLSQNMALIFRYDNLFLFKIVLPKHDEQTHKQTHK